MKNLIKFLLLGAVASVAFVSCKDDFKEEDFMALQRKERLKQDSILRARNVKDTKDAIASYVTELNNAGELLSFTLTVRENNAPLAGVDVTISTAAEQVATSGRTGAVVTKVTTGADGNAVFEKVSYGGAVMTLSKTGYATMTTQFTFGAIPPPTSITVGGQTRFIPPSKVYHSGVLPMFSKSGSSSTATIKGRATIQTDLTNTTLEFPPVGTVISADFAGYVNTLFTSGTIGFNNYRADDANFGSGATDATGNYTIIVPATTQAYNMTLYIPELNLAQRIAVNRLNGQPIPEEYRNVPTNFGPFSGTNAIRAVAGATAVFSAPPAAGSGLGFTLTAVARPLSNSNGGTNTTTWDTNASGINPALTTSFDIGNTVYQLTNRGAGYTSAPAIAISGGGGTGAAMKASLRGTITGVTVNAGGTAFVNGENVTVNFFYKDSATPTANNVFLSSYTASVAVTGGVITGFTLPGSGYGISSTNPFRTIDNGTTDQQYGATGFAVTISGGTGTGATATVAVSTVVDHLRLTSSGSGFTSAPTFAFSGGGGTTQAALTIVEFRTHWSVTAPTNTTPYSVLPSALTYMHQSLNGGSFTNSTLVDATNNFATILSQLKITGGNVGFADGVNSFRTNLASAARPTLVETTNTPIKSAGTVMNIDPTTGTLGTQFGSPVAGSGYSSPPTVSIVPAITGAPGSGAIVGLTAATTYNLTTGAYSWSGAAVTPTNAGSGYLQNLNQTSSAVGYSITNASFNVKSGLTIIINIDFGSGFKLENVQ